MVALVLDFPTKLYICPTARAVVLNIKVMAKVATKPFLNGNLCVYY